MNHTPTPGLIKSVEHCLRQGGAIEDDIAFVTSAVVAHEDLVKALKRIAKALRQESGPEEGSTLEMCELIQRVTHEALAKAGVKP